jgi:hypothetical protein
LEELLPKDNEKIPFLDDELLAPAEPQGFAPDQMVRCDECLRANPPTKTKCFYCGASLPVNDKAADFRKPSLGPVDSRAQAYNVILLNGPENLKQEVLEEAAKLIRLDANEFSRILYVRSPLPIARSDTFEDSSLICERLKTLHISAAIVSDKDLDMQNTTPTRARALEFADRVLVIKDRPEGGKVQIPWSQLTCLVTGRLFTKRVEVKERKVRRRESEIVEASEAYADDLVMDIYSETQSFRIFSNRFDYSCLLSRSMIAAENFSLLLNRICESAPQIAYDDSYNSIRQLLDLVWPPDQRVDSQGWHRERLGKLSFGTVTESSSEVQFTRYSRLVHFMKSDKPQFLEDDYA